MLNKISSNRKDSCILTKSLKLAKELSVEPHRTQLLNDNQSLFI